MKKLLLLLLLISPAASFASGITFNVGGSFNFIDIMPNTGWYEGKNTKSLGGGYSIELGYLWLSKGVVISAIDIRAGFAQSFNDIEVFDGEDVYLKKGKSFRNDMMNAYGGFTYAAGRKTKNGTFLVDVLGISFGWITGKQKNTQDGTVVDFGNAYQLGIHLPLGMHYVADHGFMIGFRHKFDFAFGDSAVYDDGSLESGSVFGSRISQSTYFAYTLTFSLGHKF